MSIYLKNFFTDYTIAHALDNSRIQRELEESRNKSLASKITQGISVGVDGLTKAIVIGFLISIVAKQFFDSTNDGSKAENENTGEGLGFIYSTFTGPILEEILFRGILQNGVGCVQKLAKWVAPQLMKKTRLFNWLISPSSRVLVANSLFAYIHLYNKGHSMSTADTVVQVGSIFLTPNSSILYETTGNLAAPIACHISNNLCIRCLP